MFAYFSSLVGPNNNITNNRITNNRITNNRITNRELANGMPNFDNPNYDQEFEATDLRVSFVIALVLLVSMVLPILY